MLLSSASGEESADEISRLIRTLQTVDARLEEITGGEIDSVAGADGSFYLLRRAQVQARNADSEKQAAILNALPAHVLLLDPTGVILSYNDSWRELAVCNGMSDADFCLGSSYLTVCDRSASAGVEDAARVAAGIRTVLKGESDKFSLEYACVTNAGAQTFLVIVTPLKSSDAGVPSGAVVMHVNISEQKRAADISRSYGAAMDAITDGIVLVDRASMRIVHVNSAACRLYGRDRDDMLTMAPWNLVGLGEPKTRHLYDALIAAGGETQTNEYAWRTPAGAPAWVEVRRQAQWLSDRWLIVIMIRDITARKNAEDRIIYLNRVHAVRSGINSLIVRARSRDELFQGACRIATESGGFPMVWIGMLDRKLNRVVPVASSGIEEKLLTAISERLALNASAGIYTSLAAQAIFEQRGVFTNDLPNAPTAFFKEELGAYGVHSIGTLPLVVADDVVGILVFYVKERDFFHPDEIRLLTELSGDVAFAIDHIVRQERLDFLAFHDTLTGLPNRVWLLERVSQQLRGSPTQKPLALLLIDLERFKNLNDSLGRASGDSLLLQVGEWLIAYSDRTKLVARVTSDHFAVVLPQIIDEDDAATYLETLLKKLSNQPFVLNDEVYRIGAKAGAAVFPDDGEDADTLFTNAEAALKKAKVSGDRFLLYAQKMNQTIAGRLGLENQLRLAIDRDEMLLHYQPKFDCKTGKLVGVEALLRWNSPESGLVPPQRFISILEDTGLIHEVGRWAIHKAMSDAVHWRSAYGLLTPMAVNVSPIQLRDRSFLTEIERCLDIHRDAAASLELEITEGVIMADVQHSIMTLNAIRKMGVRIAVDDFGTGFSSLSYLSRLPVDTLKIDRSFISDMVTRPAEGQALVSNIINLAHSLRLKVVAEGVETEAQLSALRLLGCDEVQGFLFSKPLPAALFAERFLH